MYWLNWLPYSNSTEHERKLNKIHDILVTSILKSTELLLFLVFIRVGCELI